LKTRRDIGWVGPVQGGRYLDLVATSAQEMSKLPFEVYALGSPTPVMEQYLFDLLVDMVLTAKMNLPHSRPFHLFGAGHPFMFALAVALGCDLFDSAAYSIFASEDRYLTEYGTTRLKKLEHLPCPCPVCAKRTPAGLAAMPKEEREGELTRHNLYVCFSEIRRIKQAIVEGRLWEHLEMRAHGHPALLQALKHLGKYSEYIERYSPVVKRSGLFFYSSVGLDRPEVIRYRMRLLERYSMPEGVKVLLLLPDPGPKRTRRSRLYKRALAAVCEKLAVEKNEVHVCVYAPPFGVIPTELEGVYPLSQYEYAYSPDYETIEYVARCIVEYVETMKYERTVMLKEDGTWQEKVTELCKAICCGKGYNLGVLTLDSRTTFS
jgi:7-cyano-7-deazaguanine tRNA-ribosyltransferase